MLESCYLINDLDVNEKYSHLLRVFDDIVLTQCEIAFFIENLENPAINTGCQEM